MDISLLENWVNINSGTGNLAGLKIMADALENTLAEIPGTLERIPPPPLTSPDGVIQTSGDVLRARFRPEAPIQVLFSGHMDTVYDQNHPFQKLERLPGGKLHGPGVADMKGGLFIMIESVKRFLSEDDLGVVGGEILINADEETGSQMSHGLIEQAAGRNTIGLVFESCLPGGDLVRCRKGTGTFKLTVHGKAAHTGRDFHNGRNAVAALSRLLVECHQWNEVLPDAIVNVANFNSPGPVNVVPDHATAFLNIRISQPESAGVINQRLDELIQLIQQETEGIRIETSGDFLRVPKVETPADAALHQLWNESEAELGLPLSGKRDTGGSSDGNVLGAAGLPHLDGIGITGDKIHSSEEFALEGSIPIQIDKTVALLHRISHNPDVLKQPPFRE